MKNRSVRAGSVLFLAALGVVMSSAVELRAGAPTAPERLEEWLPGEGLAYLKVSRLGERLRSFLASPLRQRLEATDVGERLRADPKYRKLIEEIGRFETETNRKVVDIVSDVLGDEVVVGAYLDGGPKPGWALLARARGESELSGAIDALRTLAVSRVGFWPFTEVERRDGVALHAAGEAVAYAAAGRVLAVGDSVDRLRRILALSRGEGGAAASAETEAATLGAGDGARLASLLFRPQRLPRYDVPQKAENFVGALLAGGWLGVLGKADLLGLALDVDRAGARLELTASAKDAAAALRSFFPEAPTSPLADRLESRGALAVLQLHRDLAAFWESGEDLVDAGGLGGMREFSQFMNVVFAGRSFRDEVLPQFLPTITVVASNQTYPGLASPPTPAIPGFAAILGMREPEPFGRSFLTALQTMVSFINIDQAQKGKGENLLLLETEKIGDATLHTASRKPEKTGSPGIEHNFTPSVVMVGPHIVLSSSRELARRLIDDLAAPAAAEESAARRARDRLVIGGAPVEKLLRDNFDAIVASSMLKKGQSRGEAAAELEAAVELARLLRDVRLESSLAGDTLRVRIEVRPSDAAGAAPAPRKEGPDERRTKL